MILHYIFIYFSAVAYFENVYASNGERHKTFPAIMIPIVEQCSKELNLNMKEAETVGYKENNPCFVACFLGKLGIMKNGMIDLEEGLNKISLFKLNPDEANKLIEPVKQCAVSANEDQVSDGDKGCDRGILYVDCLHKYIEDDDPWALEH